MDVKHLEEPALVANHGDIGVMVGAGVQGGVVVATAQVCSMSVIPYKELKRYL